MKIRIFIRLYAPLALLCASLFSLPAFAFFTEYNYTSRALLVPFANFTAGETTVVPLVATRQGRVHWAFFDANGNRRAFDSFSVMAYEQYLFIWADEAAATTSEPLGNIPGYLLFAIDTNQSGTITNSDAPALGASALHLTPGDTAFLAVQPVTPSQLTNSDPTNWTTGVSQGAFSSSAGASQGDSIFVQYLIDGAPGGDGTKIYVWCDSPFTTPQTMMLDNGAGTRQEFTHQMLNNRLNIIDVDTIPGASLTGAGFIRWTLSGQTGACSVFGIITSPSILGSSLNVEAKRNRAP